MTTSVSAVMHDRVCVYHLHKSVDVCVCLCACLPPLPIYHHPPWGCEETTVVHMERHYGDTQWHRWTHCMQAISQWSTSGSLNNSAQKPGEPPPTGAWMVNRGLCEISKTSDGVSLIILDSTPHLCYGFKMALPNSSHLSCHVMSYLCKCAFASSWRRSRNTWRNTKCKQLTNKTVTIHFCLLYY